MGVVLLLRRGLPVVTVVLFPWAPDPLLVLVVSRWKSVVARVRVAHVADVVAVHVLARVSALARVVMSVIVIVVVVVVVVMVVIMVVVVVLLVIGVVVVLVRAMDPLLALVVSRWKSVVARVRVAHVADVVVVHVLARVPALARVV